MSTPPRVVVLDYGFGNVRSAVRALERVGAEVELTADARAAGEADGLVVPGVGAFAAVMEGLDGVRGGQVVDRRLAGGRPVLGICVGMQVMFEHGDEHGVRTAGLGEWPGVVAVLDAALEEDLHADADAEHRPPAGEPLADDPVPLHVQQPRHAGGVGTDTGHDQAVGFDGRMRVGGDLDIGPGARHSAFGGAEVAGTVVEDHHTRHVDQRSRRPRHPSNE